MKEKIYETPCVVEVDMVVEQAVLAASIGDYPTFTEDDWGA